ncbi:hypothetical protein Prudu_009500 [Prunus dulcis]|uniref:Uncharacterized protein n=1 Tax=Prunus dulcis TaxID=3755 RepID=A0A4Y1R6F7_PRUDU|nr:hypothetical protein Prudu_009500 [Prunus dulcis]
MEESALQNPKLVLHFDEKQMKAEAAAATFNNPIRPLPSNLYSSPISRQINFPYQRCLLGRYNSVKGLQLYSSGSLQYSGGVVCAVNGDGRGYVSSWDEKPYEYLPTGRKSYLDEQDIVTFLDPPKDLIPLDSASYNPAAYLWRHRLLRLLEPRLISRAWEIAGTRYEDPNLAKRSASKLLSNEDGSISLEYYNCRTNGGPMPISWINSFKKHYGHNLELWCGILSTWPMHIDMIFLVKHYLSKCDSMDRTGAVLTGGIAEGASCSDSLRMSLFWMFSIHFFIAWFAIPRVEFVDITLNNYCNESGGSFATGLANSFSPLYFVVRQFKEVMPTEQPCDLAYEFGDGLFDLHEYPEGFQNQSSIHILSTIKWLCMFVIWDQVFQ